MGFKLSIIKANTLDKNIKCSVHKSGRLGFSLPAIKKLNISKDIYIKIGINEDDVNDKNLYMMVGTVPDADGFKISKAGTYYYANTKGLFTKLKIDYKSNSVMFDITEFEHEGQKLYKLTRRDGKKRQKV